MVDVGVSGEEGGVAGAIYAIQQQCSDGQDRRGSDNSHSRFERKFDNEQSNDHYNNNDYNKRNTGFCYDQPSEKKDFVPIDWGKANEEAEECRRIRWEKCPSMIKQFYKEHPEVTEMTNEEVEKFREDNMNIKVSHDFSKEKTETEEAMPKPVTKFYHAFENYPDLMNEIKKAGFDRPSPIQSQMWPILLRGEDCIGIAQTGTGKTLGENDLQNDIGLSQIHMFHTHHKQSLSQHFFFQL